MALTISKTGFKIPPALIGGRRVGYADITFDNSYPTGGEAISAANLGLNAIEGLWQVATNVGTKSVVYDSTAGKLLVNVDGGAAITQAGNGTDQSGLTVRCAYVGY